mmetsp:Transcript_20007/g.47717  ORF Transcript_20007/g.47717 Transcript_20007/m.47717 type:complete len:277 (+) Transcript_20007:168-998(+)
MSLCHWCCVLCCGYLAWWLAPCHVRRAMCHRGVRCGCPLTRQEPERRSKHFRVAVDRWHADPHPRPTVHPVRPDRCTLDLIWNAAHNTHGRRMKTCCLLHQRPTRFTPFRPLGGGLLPQLLHQALGPWRTQLPESEGDEAGETLLHDGALEEEELLGDLRHDRTRVDVGSQESVKQRVEHTAGRRRWVLSQSSCPVSHHTLELLQQLVSGLECLGEAALEPRKPDIKRQGLETVKVCADKRRHLLQPSRIARGPKEDHVGGVPHGVLDFLVHRGHS